MKNLEPIKLKQKSVDRLPLIPVSPSPIPHSPRIMVRTTKAKQKSSLLHPRGLLLPLTADPA